MQTSPQQPYYPSNKAYIMNSVNKPQQQQKGIQLIDQKQDDQQQQQQLQQPQNQEIANSQEQQHQHQQQPFTLTYKDLPVSKCVYHADLNITNFCQEPQCLLPLCPECIPLHIQMHKQQNQFPQIERIENVQLDSLKTIHDIKQKMQDNANVINDLQNQYNSKETHKLRDQISQSKQKTLEIVNQYFDSIENELENLLKIQAQKSNEELSQASRFIDQKYCDLTMLQSKLVNEKFLKYLVRIYSSNYIQESLSFNQDCHNYIQSYKDNELLGVQVDDSKLYNIQMELSKHIQIQNSEKIRQSAQQPQEQQQYIQNQQQYFISPPNNTTIQNGQSQVLQQHPFQPFQPFQPTLSQHIQYQQHQQFQQQQQKLQQQEKFHTPKQHPGFKQTFDYTENQQQDQQQKQINQSSISNIQDPIKLDQDQLLHSKVRTDYNASNLDPKFKSNYHPSNLHYSTTYQRDSNTHNQNLFNMKLDSNILPQQQQKENMHSSYSIPQPVTHQQQPTHQSYQQPQFEYSKPKY